MWLCVVASSASVRVLYFLADAHHAQEQEEDLGRLRDEQKASYETVRSSTGHVGSSLFMYLYIFIKLLTNKHTKRLDVYSRLVLKYPDAILYLIDPNCIQIFLTLFQFDDWDILGQEARGSSSTLKSGNGSPCCFSQKGGVASQSNLRSLVTWIHSQGSIDIR